MPLDLNQYTEKQFRALAQVKQHTLDSCKLCEGKGCVKLTGCDARAAFMWCSELIHANIPMTYWGLDIEHLDKIPQAVRNVVIDLMNHSDKAAKEGMGLILSGEWGIGKTALLCEIGKDAILRGRSVLYCLADDYVRSIMRPETLNTRRSVDQFDLILLDELDKVYIKAGSDFSIKEIEKLLRTTMPFSRQVMIATNATEGELMQQFGPSTVSIIKRHLRFIEYAGDDQANVLQKNWFDRLHAKDVDYMNPNVLKAARTYYKKYGHAI